MAVGVCTTYCLGLFVSFITTHCLLSMVICTSVPGTNVGSFFAWWRMSKCSRCCCCLLLASRFCSCSKSGHFGLSWVWKVGMVFGSFLPIVRRESILLTGVWSNMQAWLTLCLSPFSVCFFLFGLIARVLHLTVSIWGCLGLFQIDIL